jgi:hypothetical protein
MNNEQLFQYLDERIVSLNGQDAIVKELQHLQELLSENGAEKLPARLTPRKKTRKSPCALGTRRERRRNSVARTPKIRDEYQDWLDNLPENLQSSAVADKLLAIVEPDIDSAVDTVQEAQSADLPLGFGRD